MIVFKIILVLSLIYILFQDVKERKVYWFLFPIVMMATGVLFYSHTLPELFLVNAMLNSMFIGLLFFVMYLYSKFKLKTALNQVFGLGDALLFIGLIGSFSVVSFIMVFVFSLVFSLVLHVLLKAHQKEKTIPLAGYMSLFFLLTYISFWTGITTKLYSI
ncbi:hypothetical protein [Winogradskyella haliclonae]|uniref:General secretion pathway protein n=1 Tax=Winogradskyella haliclonae TaxID=2048558 RepID=A0ABQ2C1Z0_9FLAO|nr:hypothetical protein [Winogradskyella haliclonae]GGI58499.1 general secretion pathway protein [Winogradskyella haliclonae]